MFFVWLFYVGVLFGVLLGGVGLSEKELTLCCGHGGGGRIANCRSDLILPNIRDRERGEDEEQPGSKALGRSSAPPCPAVPGSLPQRPLAARDFTPGFPARFSRRES